MTAVPTARATPGRGQPWLGQPLHTERRTVTLTHPDATFLREAPVLVETWDDGIHTAIYLPLLLAAMDHEVNGEQRTWQDALACHLVETAQELRDRGDDQLTAEDLRTWAHLCTLLRLHDKPTPPPPDPEYRRHHLTAGWWVCRTNGRPVFTWQSPRWPDSEGSMQAVLDLSPTEARRLAALLEGC